MVTGWSVLRFVHVLSAAVWVGGQLTLSLLMLPLLRRRLPVEVRTTVMSSVGKTFGIYTAAIFLPLQTTAGRTGPGGSGRPARSRWVRCSARASSCCSRPRSRAAERAARRTVTG